MTNLIQNFLATRAAKTPKQPVTNDGQAVTRAEFNTLLQAVHGLIEDFDAVASPDKLQAALNSAFESALKGATPLSNTRHPSNRFVAPEAKDDAAPIANGAKSRFIAPAGE
jgi:hypothetical protein